MKGDPRAEAGMLIRAATYALGTRFLILASGLLSSIITARALGPEGRGQYYLMLMIGALGAQLGCLGLHAGNTYQVARNPDHFPALLRNSVWAAVGLGVPVTLVACWWLAPSDSEGYSTSLPFWAVAYAPGAMFVLLASNLYLGVGRNAAFNGTQLAASLTVLAGVSIVAALSGDIELFALVTVLATLLVSIGTFVVSGVSLGPFDSDVFRKTLRFSLRAFFVSLLSFVFLRANVFILARNASPDEVGYYSVALQCADLLLAVPTSIAAVLFPQLLRQTDSWSATRRCVVVTSGLMAAACVITVFLADPVIHLVFGAEFASAAQVLLWLLPGVLLIGAVTILSQFFAALAYPWELIAIWVAAVVAVIVGGIWLSIAGGARGAAIAFSATSLALLIAMVVAAVRQSRRAAVIRTQETGTMG